MFTIVYSVKSRYREIATTQIIINNRVDVFYGTKAGRSIDLNVLIVKT